MIGNRDMAGAAVRATVENAGSDRDTTLRREAIVRGSELCDGGRLSV